MAIASDWKLTPLNISAPSDVFEEHRAQHRHSPSMHGYTGALLFGVTVLEETTVDQQVGEFNLPAAIAPCGYKTGGRGRP